MEKIIKEVLREIENGFYVIPEIQRKYIWKNTQIRDLIDSIYRGYPIGGIVYWEIPNNIIKDENFRSIFTPLADGIPTENGRYMIIDGQQRLTSLLLVKRGEIIIKRGEYEKRRKIHLYFNPIEERFELGNKEIKNNPEWFDVSEIIRSENTFEIINRQAEKFKDENIRKNPVILKKIQTFLERFRTYQLPLIQVKIEKDDFLEIFEEISNIFINLNSKGTRIKFSDLSLALLTAKTRKEIGTSFRKKFEDILRELEEKDFGIIDETVLIRTYSVIATETVRFNEVRKILENKNGKEIEDLLERSKEAVFHTITLLKDIGITTGRFLQSKYLIVPIAYYIYKDILKKGNIIKEGDKLKVAKWLILSSMEKRYTGKLETELREDIKSIKEKGIEGLFSNLSLKEIPLSYFDGEFENRHLTLLLILFKMNKTRDWNLKSKPNIKEITELDTKDLSIHHIFPKEYLERRNDEMSYNKFANITIISEKANKSIGFRDPRKYLKELKEVDENLLREHFVPTDESLWELDNFEEFLKKRIELLIEFLQEKIGILVVI